MSAASDRSARDTVLVSGALSSLLVDFSVRSAPKSGIPGSVIDRLPMPGLDHPLIGELVLRSLRLNCITPAYTGLWEECWSPGFVDDHPTIVTGAMSTIGKKWSASTPLRRAVERRNALIEVDALVALMLGVSIDDLCTIYRTQFAVLYGYDHWEYTYDANGRLVPNSVLTVWRRKGDAITEEERKAVHPGSGNRVHLRAAVRDARPGGRHAARPTPSSSGAWPRRPRRLMAELLPTLHGERPSPGAGRLPHDNLRARRPRGRAGAERVPRGPAGRHVQGAVPACFDFPSARRPRDGGTPSTGIPA